MIENRDKTQIFTSQGNFETDCPIMYTGNYLLISIKEKSSLGDSHIVTTKTIPIELSHVKSVITHNLTKKYKQYEEK